MRINLDFVEHPKIMEAGDEAAMLFLRLLGWSASHRTDGVLPQSYLDRQRADLVTALQRVGLLDGAVIHDYLDYQPSAAEWAKREEQHRSAGRAGALARWGDSGRHSERHGTSNDENDGTRTRTPSLREGGSGGEKKVRRATRVPIPFQVDEPMRAWAHSKTPAVDVDRETEKFLDYWRGLGGQRGTKTDWPATWRNWMRRASER